MRRQCIKNQIGLSQEISSSISDRIINHDAFISFILGGRRLNSKITCKIRPVPSRKMLIAQQPRMLRVDLPAVWSAAFDRRLTDVYVTARCDDEKYSQ